MYKSIKTLHVRAQDMPPTGVKPDDLDSPRYQALVDSIQRHGVLNPIVIDANGVIIVGHYRYWAACKAGRKMVPVELEEKCP